VVSFISFVAIAFYLLAIHLTCDCCDNYHSNFGKLNYYLGARAALEGRPSRYPEIDFCKDPEAICASEEHKELKFVAGLFYWRE
jgi:hypothetical protein